MKFMKSFEILAIVSRHTAITMLHTKDREDFIFFFWSKDACSCGLRGGKQICV